MHYTRYLPAAVWSAVLLFLGNQPALDVGRDLPPGTDKVAHFVIYGILGALCAWGWARVRSPARAILVAAAILVGAADEWNQRTVPGRSSEVADLAADMAGIAAGFLIVERLTGKRGRTKNA